MNSAYGHYGPDSLLLLKYVQDDCLTSIGLLIPVIVQIGVNWTDIQQIYTPMRLLAAVRSLKMRRANTCFAWQSFTVTFKYT